MDAINMPNYSDKQIVAQVKTVVEKGAQHE
jgi:hypothetical protein